MATRPHLIGLIADTHGLLRPEAVSALAGSDLILHAGDVGAPAILEALAAIAPIIAVRGNNDHGPWAEKLPAVEVVAAGGAHVYLLHDVHDLDLDPRAAGFAAVVSGHSHRPSIVEKDGVLFVNPGSAGPRRFTLPVAVARLTIGAKAAAVRAEILPLAV
jgi:putative phosphoesterase